LQPGYEGLVDFLAENRLEIVDKQRGDGVFEASVQALLPLNKAG